MKRRIICLLVFLFIITGMTLAGCSNRNPNIGNSEDMPAPPTSTGEPADIPAYIDRDALANRSYELRFLLAQERFSSPEQMPVNALVQFAFCHIYYQNLCEMPATGMKLREATKEMIDDQIEKYFGELKTDITQSDLFHKATGKFQMWEPTYGTELFYDSKLVAAADHLYVCTTTFYTDSKKQDVLGKTVLTVEDSGGRAVIKKLSSR